MATKKQCPKCNKGVTSNNFARHVRCCKGIIVNGKRKCPYCDVWMRANNLKRHITSKHSDQSNQLTLLRKENKDLLENIIQKNTELVRKDAKNHALMNKIRELETQLVAAPKQKTINHHHHHHTTILLSNLAPLSLHPSDPGYEECKADFMRQLETKFGDTTHSSFTYKYMCISTATKFLFGGDKIRYVTTDLGRKKGMYMTPDGRLQYDPRQEKASSFFTTCVTKKLDNHSKVSQECYYEVMEDCPKNFMHRVTSDGYTSYKHLTSKY